MTDENRAENTVGVDVVGAGTADVAIEQATPQDASRVEAQEDSTHDDTTTQYGVGPFTVRELAILVGWALAFLVSFFSISTVRFDSVWTSGLLWILTIGVPTVAVFLIVLRRFSPDGIRRVGSLGIDQFASVAFSVSAVLWLQLLWETVAFAAAGGVWLRGWVVWVELALMISLVVLTVFAPFIPPLAEDFQHRTEAAAHRNARPVRGVIARPRPVATPVVAPANEAPADAAAPSADASFVAASSAGVAAAHAPVAQLADADVPAAGAADADASVAHAAGSDMHDETAQSYNETTVFDTLDPADEPVTASDAVQPEPELEPAGAPTQQAFWALSPDERDIVDDHGIPIFRMGPTAWALVIEERDEVFVVRHEDGRIGYLHDVAGVTRG